jgi:citrate lyase beta subunit
MQRRPVVLHFVPYASDEMLRKAMMLKADALVLDLEDSVTPDNKESARRTVTEWLRQVDFPRQKRLVRINALDSEWGRTDVENTMAGRPDGFLVPKAGDLIALRELDSFLIQLEKLYGYPERSVELFPIIETPKGVMHVNEVTSCPRVTAICGGRGGLDMAAALAGCGKSLLRASRV